MSESIHNPTFPEDRRGGGRGRGMALDSTKQARHRHDQDVFHRLLALHADIRRELHLTDSGIRSLTTSENPEVVSLLHDHVPSMHQRLQENFGLRFWDPAFAELFAQHDKVQMEVTLLPNGVLVEERSDDPNVARLIQGHGQIVSLFSARGFAQAQEASPLPEGYRPVLV
ncbi:MAG: hypothetical protein ACP5D5_00180 [Acidithiobacillus sp.]|uniref:hypothetical protein n=1 Tax=Acidithiobacillus sp. TaxID=1872118 RepID=UPI003D080CEB